jgi:hypothetical protein
LHRDEIFVKFNGNRECGKVGDIEELTQTCHLERNKVIGEAGDVVESKGLP